jgi:hypothetical protein
VTYAELVDKEKFLDFRLLDQKQSRLLTPPGKCHSLRAVVDRMQAHRWTFDDLASPIVGISETDHDPKWFEKCYQTDFDPKKAHWIAITPYRSDDETCSGPFSIFEGQHRSLVFAYRIISGQDFFSPRRLFILLPRRWPFPAPAGS